MPLVRPAAALRVHDLDKVYSDGTRGLRGLSLEIPAGSVFGLLGPNGSGKSTLIGMVSGLARGPVGRIHVFGVDAIADASAARLDIGVAPQDVHLDRFLRVRDVLIYHGRYFGMAQDEAQGRADELLGVFDLTAKVRARPNRLSGGMRRRLLIARALMHRPRLLILDEPTAGVDLELRRELWTYLRRLHEHEDATILLTTHYLEEAEALCDRVAFIRDGRVIAVGGVADLVERFGGSDLEDAYVQAMRP